MRSDGSKRGWDGHQKNKKHGGDCIPIQQQYGLREEIIEKVA